MCKECKYTRNVNIQGKVKESKRKEEKESKEGGGIPSITPWKYVHGKVNVQVK